MAITTDMPAPAVPATAPSIAGPSGGSRTAAITWGSLALSALCLYLAMRGAPLGEIAHTLRDAQVWMAAPLLALLAAFYLLKAIRWTWLLAPVTRTDASRLLGPMMIGFMGNNVLPARLGELVRMYLGARLLGIAPSQVLATLVLERVFDFSAVLLLLGAGIIAAGDQVPRSILSAGYAAGAVSVAAMLALAIFVTWTETVLRWSAALLHVLPSRLADAVLRQLELAASGLAALRHPRLLAGIVVTSIAQWFLMACCVYVSCRAVDVGAPLAAALVVLGVTVFGVMIPAAPGYFGTLHLSFVLALTPFGVADQRAMAAAVFYHAIPYVAVTAVGLLYLRDAGIRLRDIHQLNQGS
jgi:uncharacterized protein (TIRG00374 family)